MKRYYLLALLFTISLSTFAQSKGDTIVIGDYLVVGSDPYIFNYQFNKFRKPYRSELFFFNGVDPKKDDYWYQLFDVNTLECWYIGKSDFKIRPVLAQQDIKDSLKVSELLTWDCKLCSNKVKQITIKQNDTIVLKWKDELQTTMSTLRADCYRLDLGSRQPKYLEKFVFIGFVKKNCYVKLLSTDNSGYWYVQTGALTYDIESKVLEAQSKLQIGDVVYFKHENIGVPYTLVKITNKENNYGNLAFKNIKGEFYTENLSLYKDSYFTKEQFDSLKVALGANWKKILIGKPWLGMTLKQFKSGFEYFSHYNLYSKSTFAISNFYEISNAIARGDSNYELDRIIEKRNEKEKETYDWYTTKTNTGTIVEFKRLDKKGLTFTNGILTKIIE